MNKTVLLALVLVCSASALKVKSSNFLATGVPSYMSIEVHTATTNADNEEDWNTVELNHKFDNPVVLA